MSESSPAVLGTQRRRQRLRSYLTVRERHYFVQRTYLAGTYLDATLPYPRTCLQRSPTHSVLQTGAPEPERSELPGSPSCEVHGCTVLRTYIHTCQTLSEKH